MTTFLHLFDMNSTNSTEDAIIAEYIIEEVYENYVYILVIFSTITLAFYTTLLKLSQEIEHIWSKSFSLPSLLYIFTRYGILFAQAFRVALIFMSAGRACNIVASATNVSFLLFSVGNQGLLVIRAYSICRANKILASALGLFYVSAIALNMYGIIAFPGCATNGSLAPIIISLIGNVLVVCTDLLIFGICMWKIWGTWKLKREIGEHSGSSLTSVLLTQSIIRCCFVVTITITGSILGWIPSLPQALVTSSYNFMEDVLSAALVANFTLDLRRLNSTKIQASQVSLPPLQFTNVLQRVHQSFLVEMATPEVSIGEEENEYSDHDDFPETLDFDIQPIED